MGARVLKKIVVRRSVHRRAARQRLFGFLQMARATLDLLAGLSELAKKDLRGYVSSGNNAVFIGSYEWLSIMNDAFGFQLMSDYKVGVLEQLPLPFDRELLLGPL